MKNTVLILSLFGFLFYNCDHKNPSNLPEKPSNLPTATESENSILDTTSISILSGLVYDTLNKYDIPFQPRIIPISSPLADLMELKDDLLELEISIKDPQKIVRFNKKKFKKIDESEKNKIIDSISKITDYENYKILVEFGIGKIGAKYKDQSVRMSIVKKNGISWNFISELYNDGFDSSSKSNLKSAYIYLKNKNIEEFYSKNYGGNLFEIENTKNWLSSTNAEIYIHQVFDLDKNGFYTCAIFTNNPNPKIKDKTKKTTVLKLNGNYSYGNRGSNCCP